jgi:Skp family chaperone for outer membrane proteins
MKILVFVFSVILITFSSCTNIKSEGEMLADYCYCKVLSAKDAEEKEDAKRQCNDMKNQVEKQHGKELSKLSKEDQELFYDGFLKTVESCK